MPDPGPYHLMSAFLRLRPDASVEPLVVDDTFWQRISAGQLGSFHNEYVVSWYAFDSDWPMWEMHPNGDEVVCLISGAVTFVMERETGLQTVDLTESGAFVVVPRGTWHTARVRAPSRALFITPGEGTQHRPVSD
mgnify:CR=1 FL=1